MGPLVPNDQSDALHREKGGWSWTVKVHKETKREGGLELNNKGTHKKGGFRVEWWRWKTICKEKEGLELSDESDLHKERGGGLKLSK